jgi:hypothetical protein
VYYAATPIFTDPAISRAISLIPSIDAERAAALETALRSGTPSLPLVAYLKSVVHEAISGTLIDRIATRLENDQVVEAALK